MQKKKINYILFMVLIFLLLSDMYTRFFSTAPSANGTQKVFSKSSDESTAPDSSLDFECDTSRTHDDYFDKINVKIKKGEGNDRVLIGQKILVQNSSKEFSPKGIVLFLHGLNNDPNIFDFLERYIGQKGYVTVRGILRGHGGDLSTFKEVKAQDWLVDARDLRCGVSALQRKFGGIKTYFVGYSLGALTMTAAINSPQSKLAPFDYSFLFAPALFIEPPLWTLSLLKLFGNLLIPSFNAPELTAHSGTSPNAYIALGNLTKTVNHWDKSKLDTVKSSIFMDPEDELVDYKAVAAFYEKLPSQKLIPVSTNASTFYKPRHHLIFSEAVLGPDWKIVQKEIDNVLP